MPDFHIRIANDDLVFCAAHFITLAGNNCERLHGHTYHVAAEVHGPLDENQYVVDFLAVRTVDAGELAKFDLKKLPQDALLPPTTKLWAPVDRPGKILCLGLTFVKLIVLDVLLTGLSILLEFAALAALRIREPHLPRPYRVPGGLFGALAIGVPPLALLVLTAVRSHIEPVGPIDALQLGALLIALGAAVYFVARRPIAG